MMAKSRILDGKAIGQKINRLAWQIYENNSQEKEIVLVGIFGRGEIIASDLSQVINQISSIKTKIATIHLDKDSPYQTEITINLDLADYTNKVVILID